MLNQSIFVGRLTRDIEIQYTKKSQKPVAEFNIAVQRDFTNSKGEREADFPRFLVWEKTAQNLANFTHKGSLILVRSHTTTSSYERDGQKIYRTDNVVDYFNFLESNNDNKPADNHPQESNNSGNYNRRPADNMQKDSNDSNASDPFVDNSTPIDISDDDLPF